MNKNKVQKYISVTREIAKIHLPCAKSFFHVSIITDLNGNFLTTGINGIKTHPLNQKFNYRTDELHSELAAFLGIRWKDVEFNIINFRFNNQLELRNSKPCNCCYNWLLTTRVNEIWYSWDNGDMIKL